MQSLSSQRGLSLIELMIGILLSALLLLGVLQIFDSNRDTMRMQVAYTRVQESGRFAIDLLTREIRMADYWGCAPDRDSIQDHLDHSDDDYKTAIHGMFGGGGVSGKDNVAVTDTVADTAPIANTDILTLAGAQNACGGIGRMLPSSNADALHVSQNCGVRPGAVVLISNCKGGELMTVTNVQDGTGGDSSKRTITHNSGVDGLAGEDQGWVKNQNLEIQQEYGADSTILQPYSRTFFVANSNVTGTTSLFMSENGGDPQELVPGIADMQVRYGRDSTGNGMVDVWQDANNNAADMEQVAVIRVQLLVASDGSAGVDSQDIPDLDGDGSGQTFTDGRLRKLYTATAKVRNRGSM